MSVQTRLHNYRTLWLPGILNMYQCNGEKDIGMAKKTNKEDSSLLWITILLAIVMVVGFVAYVYLGRQPANREARQGSPQQEAPQTPLPQDTSAVATDTTPVPPSAPRSRRTPAEQHAPESSTGSPRFNDDKISYTGYDFTKAPGFAYPTTIPGEQVVRYTGFTLSYNEQHEQASWVAYMLTGEQVKGTVKRADDFREDKQIKTRTASPSDYRGSGYDRGHLAPAGDMKWSAKAMSESFYMSNMSPQAPAFNRGVWNKLEERVRKWAVKHDELYVVTGPVLEPGLPTIGANEVSVPRQYYKVMLRTNNRSDIIAIGFLLENEGSELPLKQFVVPIDSIEKVTGLDFFPLLPDEIEEKLESRVSLRGWF
jgi:endonuclease G, mitochondrial